MPVFLLQPDIDLIRALSKVQGCLNEREPSPCQATSEFSGHFRVCYGTACLMPYGVLLTAQTPRTQPQIVLLP